MGSLLKELEELNAPAAALPDVEDANFDDHIKRRSKAGDNSDVEEDGAEPLQRRRFNTALELDDPKYKGETVRRSDVFGDSSEMVGLKPRRKKTVSIGSEGDDYEDEDGENESDEGEDDDEDSDKEDSSEGEEEGTDDEEEKVTMKDLVKPTVKNDEQKKGESVQKQMALCDQVLLLNIKAHGALRACNQLPRDAYARALAAQADDATRANVLQAQRNALRMVCMLLEVEEAMLGGSSQTKGLIKKKGKAGKGNEGDNGELDSEDEEIESSEDEGEDKGKKPNGTANKGGRKGKEEEDVHMEDEEDDDGSIPDYNVEGTDDSGSDDEREEGEKKSKKLPGLPSLRKRCIQSEMRFEQFRTNTLRKWDARTRLVAASKKKKEGGQGDFSAFEGDVIGQIDKILSDQRRLIARTQVKRSDHERIGGDTEATHDPEIFDDDDFYQVLLRDLIERKSSGETMDSVAMSRQWLELEKLRQKRSKKKKVDTKATKGRKIRYTVIPKLVNFHAAAPERVAWSHEMRNELYKSLFK